MPITYSVLEQRFARIVQGLCEAHRLTSGLPASTALPFVSPFEPGDRVRPNVLFHAEQLEQRGNRNVVHLKVEMVCQANHDDTTETAQSDWANRLRRIIRDKTKMAAYLTALSEADRSGFRILRYFVASGGISFDAETKVRSFSTSMSFIVVTDELQAL